MKTPERVKYTLHLGVKDAESLRMVAGTIGQDIDDTDLIICDGDSWEVWGEGRTSMDSAYHVQIRSTSVCTLAIWFALINDAANLVPMLYPEYQRAVIGAITLTDEWSEAEIVFSSPKMVKSS